jgi:hypothetical protein
MRSILRRCAVLGSIAIVAILGLPAGGAYADNNDGHAIVVQKDQSIQKAIDAAPAGSTIVVERGTYKENLTISKDHITLKSKRGRDSVVLQPASTPTKSDCIQAPTAVPGICVLGQITPLPTPGGSGGPPVVGTPVTGTRIDGFVVENFTNFGVLLLNANDSAVTNSEARHNKSYGISGFVLSGIRFVNNVAHDNGDPGFYIGDSPHANALVVGNRSFRNGVGGDEGFGFLFRDSSHGVVRDNSASDNCVGFVFVDTPAPGPESDWRVAENSALHNPGFCPGAPPLGPPPTSGIGFVLLGTDHVTLQENTARDNQPSPSGKSPVPSGGIVVLFAPTDNVIEENKAFGNSPFDIFWDGSGSGNKFEDNRCSTSQPPGLCQSGRND